MFNLLQCLLMIARDIRSTSWMMLATLAGVATPFGKLSIYILFILLLENRWQVWQGDL